MKQIVIGHLSEEDAPAVWQAVVEQADALRKLAPTSPSFYIDVRDELPEPETKAVV